MRQMRDSGNDDLLHRSTDDRVRDTRQRYNYAPCNASRLIGGNESAPVSTGRWALSRFTGNAR